MLQVYKLEMVRGLFTLIFLLIAGASEARDPFYLTEVSDDATQMWAISPEGEEVKLYSQSHALLIGQSHYQNGADWNELKEIPAEVLELRDVLERHRFKVELHFDLNEKELLETIDGFMRRRATIPDSRIFVFVSGHGHRVSIDRFPPYGYLMPVNAPLKSVGDEKLAAVGLPMDMFDAWMRVPYPRHMLFAFDECFSGTIFHRQDPSYDSGRVSIDIVEKPKAEKVKQQHRVQPLEEGNDIFVYSHRDKGRQFLTAGGGNQIAPKKSVFTRTLIDALSGQLWVGANYDPWITVSELGSYLEHNTIDRYPPEERNRATPVFGHMEAQIHQGGDFVFTRLDKRNDYLLDKSGLKFPDNHKSTAFEKIASSSNRAARELSVAYTAEILANNQERIAQEYRQQSNMVAADASELTAKNLRQAQASALEKADQFRTAALKEAGQNQQAVLDVIESLTEKQIASTKLPDAEKLSEDEEKRVQNIIKMLSDNDKNARRNARQELSLFLDGLSDLKKVNLTTTLLREFSRKSYRYQTGVAVVLANQKRLVITDNIVYAQTQLKQAALKTKDPTLKVWINNASQNISNAISGSVAEGH